MSDWSQTFTYYEGRWIEGNPPILGPRDHAFWLASIVFDGARAFEGVAPDLDRHCARVNHSAETMWLKPTMAAEAIQQLAWDGIKKFAPGTELYIRPMYWAERNGPGSVPPDPESTKFLLNIYEAALSDLSGIAITRSRFAKPLAITMPIDAKAACLYPNNARALMEARSRGFDNCLLADMLGNVAELATANIFLARDGIVMTPVANGSFLNGITRQRVLKLLKADGVDVREATLSFADFESADVVPQHSVSARQLAIPKAALREYLEAEKDLGMRNPDAAVKRLEAAVEIDPQFSVAWNELGTIAYQTRKFDRAEECFRQALVLDPRAFDPLVNLGGVLVTVHKLDEAADYNLRAVLTRPNDALANSQLGLTYFEMARMDLAEKYLERTRHIDAAHFSHPQLLLAEIHLRRGERREAADVLEEFLKYHPDWPQAAKMRQTIPELRQ